MEINPPKVSCKRYKTACGCPYGGYRNAVVASTLGNAFVNVQLHIPCVTPCSVRLGNATRGQNCRTCCRGCGPFSHGQWTLCSVTDPPPRQYRWTRSRQWGKNASEVGTDPGTAKNKTNNTPPHPNTTDLFFCLVTFYWWDTKTAEPHASTHT